MTASPSPATARRRWIIRAAGSAVLLGVLFWLLPVDEVMAGLRPAEVDEMVAIIRRLREQGVTIFVIEHIMRAIMALSDRVVVIQFGQKIAEGLPQQVAADENVIKAYLGEEYAVS